MGKLADKPADEKPYDFVKEESEQIMLDYIHLLKTGKVAVKKLWKVCRPITVRCRLPFGLRPAAGRRENSRIIRSRTQIFETVVKNGKKLRGLLPTVKSALSSYQENAL